MEVMLADIDTLYSTYCCLVGMKTLLAESRLLQHTEGLILEHNPVRKSTNPFTVIPDTFVDRMESCSARTLGNVSSDALLDSVV